MTAEWESSAKEFVTLQLIGRAAEKLEEKESKMRIDKKPERCAHRGGQQ